MSHSNTLLGIQARDHLCEAVTAQSQDSVSPGRIKLTENREKSELKHAQ